MGFLISSVAAVPPLLMTWGGRQSDFKKRLKLWAIGLGIRFAIIGALLILVFTQTTLDRVLAVIGIGAAYLISFGVECLVALRHWDANEVSR